MSLNLLIADDEHVIRAGIANSIDWESLDVTIVGFAENGIEALEQIKQLHVDLVITDINMPFCDGLRFIEKCKHIKPDIQFIILSGFDKFEYVKKALHLQVNDYLLKPIKRDELIDTVLNIQHKLHHKSSTPLKRDESFQKLIAYNLLPEHQLKLLQDQLNLSFPAQILVFDTPYSQLNIINLLRNSNYATTGEFFPCSNSKIGMFIPTKSLTENSSIFAKELLHFIYRETSLSLSCGIGQKVTTISQISNSYQSAIHYLTYQLYNLPDGIYDCSLNHDPSLIPQPIENYFYTELFHAIVQQDLDKIPPMVESFFTKILYHTTPPPSFVLGSCNHLMVELSKHLQRYPMIYSHISLPEIMKEIQEKTSLTTLKEWLIETLSHFAYMIDESSMRNYNPHINEALLYIEKNITSKLSLEDVAKHIHLNKNYFTVLFKETTGENFRNYVLNCKIEYAKELLRESPITTSNLALLLGYEEPRSFIRAFKNVTTKTPSEYAKLYHNY